MTTISWPVIVGIFVAGGVLSIGVAAAVIQGIIRNPKKRADIANIYTDKNIKILQQQWATRYKTLEGWHEDGSQLTQKNDEKLTEMQNRLHETRLALRLLTNATEQSIKILKETIGEDQVKINKLEQAIEIVQKIISRP